MTDNLRRLQILQDLQDLGISGWEANFIELVPLVEMIWADERCQEGELAVLDHYISRLVNRLNEFNPSVRFTIEDAEDFAMRFIEERPSRELLRVLRDLALELAEDLSKEILLQACLDIAASSVCSYPYEVDERFNPAEKRTFFEILKSIEDSA